MEKFTVKTPKATPIFSNVQANRMAQDILHALRNAGIKVWVVRVMFRQDEKLGTVADIEVESQAGATRQDMQNVIDFLYG